MAADSARRDAGRLGSTCERMAHMRGTAEAALTCLMTVYNVYIDALHASLSAITDLRVKLYSYTAMVVN